MYDACKLCLQRVKQTDRKSDRSMKTAMPLWTRLGIAICKIIMATTKVDLAPDNPFSLFIKFRRLCTWMKMACTCSKYECFFDNWLSRYKHLKTLPQHKSILQKCPRFWPQAPSRSLNRGSILIELQKILLCTHASNMNAFCYVTVEIRTHKNIIAVWRARTHTRTSFRTEMTRNVSLWHRCLRPEPSTPTRRHFAKKWSWKGP